METEGQVRTHCTASPTECALLRKGKGQAKQASQSYTGHLVLGLWMGSGDPLEVHACQRQHLPPLKVRKRHPECPAIFTVTGA